MEHISLTYGPKGFEEIQDFLTTYPKDDYSLSIYNITEQNTAEINCSFDEMLDVIMLVSSTEHDFPHWIGINRLSDSYVVGMKFAMGRIQTPAIYEYKDGTLTKIDFEKKYEHLFKKE